MNDRRSMLIVVNPISGQGRGLRLAEAVAEILRACHNDVTVRHTSEGDGAESIVRTASLQERDRPDCIVACGGDGTVQQVAHVLASLRDDLGDRCPALGLAPAGRCNDFARALSVQRDPDAIADVLLNGTPVPIDLGRVGDRHFCTVVTVGVDADITDFVDTMRMPLKGTLAYLYGTMRVLTRYRGRSLRIEGDFGVIERTIFVASSANTPSYGGAIKIAPAADPTDGKLDLCVINQVSMARMATLLPRVLLGRHAAQPEVEFHKTERLTIEAPERVELWADGERVGCTPVTIQSAPGAVRVLLPAGWRHKQA